MPAQPGIDLPRSQLVIAARWHSQQDGKVTVTGSMAFKIARELEVTRVGYRGWRGRRRTRRDPRPALAGLAPEAQPGDAADLGHAQGCPPPGERRGG